MRVLMVIRPDADSHFGGDRVQMIETAKALRTLGVDIVERVGPALSSDYDNVEIVHLFNLLTPQFTMAEAVKAKAAGRKVVLSTIWWERPIDVVFDTSAKWRLIDRIVGRKAARKLLKPLENKARGRSRQPLSQICRECDLLITNSDVEKKELTKLGRFDNIAVAHLGIDTERFDPSRELTRPDWLPSSEYVLCSGRIEAFKGQAMLAGVANQLGVPCVLVGHETEPDEAEKCRQHGAILVGPKFGDDLVASYKFAKLHVQPSKYEVPGLSTLEAAAMGCPVVASINGSARDYLGGTALYLDPYVESSVKHTLEIGLTKGHDPELSAAVRSRFSWRTCAQTTARQYAVVN